MRINAGEFDSVATVNPDPDLSSRPRFKYIGRMNRSDALAKLKIHAATIKAMGATSLYVFGSTVRDDAGPDSDLDLFIDYDRHGKFNAFDLVGIKQFLESELGMQVDVT